ncbi:MAG: M20/M25/M40 family metallo-hydrolase [Polyangiaceae bacterium]|nr:M20/M25/M40 family metallo-hydrolase [Polyangiaceae bacterium]
MLVLEDNPDRLDIDSTAFGRIDADIQYLASPELAGRGTGDPGARLAAEMIRTRFQRLGLKPYGDALNGAALAGAGTSAPPGTSATPSYFQRFDARVGANATRPILLFGNAKKSDVPAVVADGSSTATAKGTLVFVGYGVTAAAVGWDDYAGKEIEGKIAVILAGAPRASKTDDKLKALRDFGSSRYKIRTAREHKAAGVLIVTDAEELPSAPLDPSGMGLPAAVLTRTDAATRIKGVDFKADKIWDVRASGSPKDLGKTQLELTTRVDAVTADAWNVLAALPAREGSPHAAEWVVVGAHYDHLGMGNQFSRAPGKRAPHFGADDNASGTAMMLEVAHRLSKLPTKPDRNVLFAAWGAEEMGLVGSRYFVDHTTVPAAQITAMINADMVGRLRERQLLIDGTATAAGWTDLIKTASDGLRLQLTFGAEGYGASDHATFTAAKVPVAFLFTGVHEDYHLPSDTADKINIDGISAISTLAARLARSAANLDNRMAFVEPPADPHRGARGGFKVSLGTLPDYAYQGKGLRITGTRPDSPASRAGLVSGDVIVKVDKHDITNIHDFMFSLGDLEPGREATLEVERNGKRVTLKIIPAPGQGGEPHPKNPPPGASPSSSTAPHSPPPHGTGSPHSPPPNAPPSPSVSPKHP